MGNVNAIGMDRVGPDLVEYRHVHLSITDKYIKRHHPGIDLTKLHTRTIDVLLRELKQLAGFSGTLAMEEVPRLLADHGIYVVMTIRGIAHVTSGLVQPSVPYDFVLPDEPDLPMAEGAQPIPYGLMLDSYRVRSDYALQFMSRLHETFGNTHLVGVAFPPPIGDDAFVLNGLGRFFHERFPAGFKIVPPLLRYKLWRMCLDLYTQQCRSGGVTYLMPPAEALVEGRYLDPRGYHTDSVHANDWYGTLVIQDILRKFP